MNVIMDSMEYWNGSIPGAKPELSLAGRMIYTSSSAVRKLDPFHEAAMNAGLIHPSAALIELTDAAVSHQEKRRNMERFATFLEQYLTEGAVVFTDDFAIVGILFSRSRKQAVDRTIASASRQLSLTVSVGIGRPQRQLSDLHLSYKQASEALRHTFYTGNKQPVYYGEELSYKKHFEYPYEQENLIYDTLRSSEKLPNIDQEIDKFYECLLKDGFVDISEVYGMTIRLLVGLEKRVFADYGESSGKRCDIISIVKLASMAEVKTYAASCLSDLHKAMHRESEPQRCVIKQSIKYMEQECKEASLQSIAQKVYMTPTYLSLLFKTNTGKTFIEQLTDIRINKAKRILETTPLKNYEVADRVGYQDSRYFSQIFKKKVGLSPSEYRDSFGKS